MQNVFAHVFAKSGLINIKARPKWSTAHFTSPNTFHQRKRTIFLIFSCFVKIVFLV